MPNPVWTKKAAAIEKAENKIAHTIAIYRAVQVLAELAETDEERAALLLILQGAARLKDMAQHERRRA
jgi:hypothetical protein